MSDAGLQRVGRYEILAKVGQGAMGVVYRAQDPTIRRIVALKVLPADPAATKTTGGTQGRSSAGLFEREAQAAGALAHPNIVMLYDAGQDANWYYLAMEFVEGETLATQIAREGKVAPERVAEIGAVVAEALDFAHERGVIHRDIKPANLMILPDQTVKVADFGIARLSSRASTMTSEMVVGTPHYMSPEQVRGGKIDGRSDLFSLGLVLYEALAGRRAYQSETLASVLNSIINVTPPPPHDVDPDLPADLSAIIMRAIQRKPEERYARGKQMTADLRRFLDRARQAPAEPAPHAKPVAKRAQWIGASALLVAASAALGAALFLRARPEPPRPAAAVGYLEFVSEPAGAEIFLDGNVVGRTPYTAEVTAGKHEVEFRKQGYYPATQSPTVEPNRRIVIELPMLARKEG